MIIIIGRAEVDPARVEDLRLALGTMMRATFEEDGCLSYSLAMESDGSDGRPAVLTIVERWADEAALHRHAVAPHMAAFSKAIEGAILSLDAKMFDATNERPFTI